MKRMKFSTRKSLAWMAILAGSMGGTLKAELVDGAFPVGWLNLTTNSIVLGSRPHLAWQVVPSSIESQVELSGTGRFSILRDALMAVRVVGVSVLDGTALTSAASKARVEIQMQVNGGGYRPIFFDSAQSGTPDEVELSRGMSSSDTIDFGARFQKSDGTWSEWRSSSNSNGHVVALKNGDPVPAYSSSGGAKNFLRPYLDAAGKVRISPNDLLLLIEIDSADASDPAFDRQDAAVLISFGDVFSR